MENPPQVDRLLVERFVRGNGTIFVGAGVSLASRLPTWKKLMAPLKEELGPDADDLDLLQVAELYEVKHGRSALVQHLKEQLGHVKFRVNKTHELLVSLPVQRIYTTNFDNLLEQASQKKQINRHVIYNASHVGLSDTSMLSIIKLHGDLADPNSIVLTARDFYSYAAKNPAVADLLKVELQTRTVLFIGYSFSDPNLAMILGNAVFQTGTTPPLIYAIQFQPTELSILAMKARGVTVIPIDAKPGTSDAEKKIEEWLQQFSRSLNSMERRRQQVLGTRKFPASSPLLMRHPYSVRSERVTDRIRSGLSSEFRVIVVRGEAGVGKTHLVADAAKKKLQPSNRSLWIEGFEQIIWIRPVLRKNGGFHTLDQIFSSITSQLDGNVQLDDSESERLRHKIEALLQERRVLIVIEDLDDPRADQHQSRAEEQRDAEATRFDDIKAWLEDIGNFSYARSRIVVTTRTAVVAGFMVEVTRLGGADAVKMVHEHARAIMLRRHFDALATVEKKVVDLTMGNPQAIRLALGLINGAPKDDWLDAAIERSRAGGSQGIEPVFDSITAAIWEKLPVDGEARRVVEAMAAFPAEEWVPSALLKCAAKTADDNVLQQALQTCLRFGLLGYDALYDNYFMHRTIKEALSRQNLIDQVQLNHARTELARHLLAFLSADGVVCRPEIPERYWNALVREEFVKIDPYWPIIESLMWWAEDQPIIVDFLLLLVHYMDSRFLNGHRLYFVNKAMAMASDLDKRTRALLNIDALGWTYIEEGSDIQAMKYIDQGLQLLTDQDNDLRALASAWKARICAKQDRIFEARIHIGNAKRFVKSCPRKFWIKARVCMMAGDVKLMEKKPNAAEKQYLDAEANEERYGGELGYQTDPRIGFALLRKADAEPKNAGPVIDKARQRFTRLAENEHVPTGRLYGEYGLALIASRENSTDDALLQLRKILKEISARQGENNVLLKLAKESYESLASSKVLSH
ncbi:SIR2 family protein [Massilia sp. Root335]|jgi:hypothetical protein|uniref:SIR2 family protein n=1 Tax=Massilia sp. Root335 TaxID=1736517 RepID=UPI0006F36D17|nr:SIR2 family protein [Massilia sp. Root335]KQV49635.1 hypothetical protein ASC93_12260 [Massilia sp. Root335]